MKQRLGVFCPTVLIHRLGIKGIGQQPISRLLMQLQQFLGITPAQPLLRGQAQGRMVLIAQTLTRPFLDEQVQVQQLAQLQLGLSVTTQDRRQFKVKSAHH
ncbi:hypothetical protein D3C79_756050 [compost metagenome]